MSPHKLWGNSTTAPDLLVGCEGFSDPFLTPLDAFSISILGDLGASSLVSHFSDQSYAPGWAPGLPPAKSGPGDSGVLYAHWTV